MGKRKWSITLWATCCTVFVVIGNGTGKLHHLKLSLHTIAWSINVLAIPFLSFSTLVPHTMFVIWLSCLCQQDEAKQQIIWQKRLFRFMLRFELIWRLFMLSTRLKQTSVNARRCFKKEIWWWLINGEVIFLVFMLRWRSEIIEIFRIEIWWWLIHGEVVFLVFMLSQRSRK